MNKEIFKKCKVLGKYHELTYPLSTSESAIFYQKNKDVIDFEGKLYSEIYNNRRKMGGDDKIHKIN